VGAVLLDGFCFCFCWISDSLIDFKNCLKFFII
jgi:hypothetical protein